MINAYYITVILGKDNKVNSPVIEEENDFISEILKADSNWQKVISGSKYYETNTKKGFT